MDREILWCNKKIDSGAKYKATDISEGTKNLIKDFDRAYTGKIRCMPCFLWVFQSKKMDSAKIIVQETGHI